MFRRRLAVADKDERRVATLVTLHGLQTPGGLVSMIVKCAICGYQADVGDGRRYHAPILGFFCQGGRHKHPVDVWICDVHK